MSATGIPRRILHLVSYPLYSGPLPGTAALALAQRALGHQVWLGYDRKRGHEDAFEEAAAARIAPLGLDPPVRPELCTKSSLRQLLRDRYILRRLVRDYHVDVVHVHQSHDHVLATLSGLRGLGAVVVRTYHAARSLRRRFGQPWLNRRADGWIVRSEAHRETLLRHFSPPAARVEVLPGGMALGGWQPARAADRAAARTRFGLPVGARVVGQVALMAGRGQEELLDAAAQLGEAAPHQLLVGRGENEASLRARVVALGLGERVHFTGYLKGEDLWQAYAAMDVAFLAQAGNDASARAALEAMAMALPVLSVQVDALAELIDTEVGYPIAGRAPALIAAGLREVLADAAEAKRRGGEARCRVLTGRSSEQEAALTLALYERLLAHRGRR